MVAFVIDLHPSKTTVGIGGVWWDHKATSQATEAIVTLEFAADTVRIAVWDNGRGFSMPKAAGALTSRGKLGIIGMQQRTRFLDGSFDIHSEPGKGTLVSVKARA